MISDNKFQESLPHLLRFIAHAFETHKFDLKGIYYDNIKGTTEQELSIRYDYSGNDSLCETCQEGEKRSEYSRAICRKLDKFFSLLAYRFRKHGGF